MAKRTFTQEDMDKINELIALNKQQVLVDQDQSNQLKEILLCLKGSNSMNIEGVIPAQKRMSSELHELNEWKQEVSIYFGMITSKRVWRFIGITIAVIAMIIVGIKYGFQTVWQLIKGMFV